MVTVEWISSRCGGSRRDSNESICYVLSWETDQIHEDLRQYSKKCDIIEKCFRKRRSEIQREVQFLWDHHLRVKYAV